MRLLLLLSCLVGTIVVAERQINLEDIERDNLASEKQTATESSQKPEPPKVESPQPNYFPINQQQQQQQQYTPASPPPINYYTRPQLIQPQQYIPASPPPTENYYRRPQFSPQELAEYITDNHLKSGPIASQPPHRISPQYYQNQPNQQFFLIPQFPMSPYHHQSQPKTDGIQYIMYLQPAPAASFLAPQTQIPNALPHIMNLALPRLYSHAKPSSMFSVQPQQFTQEHAEPQLLIQPQRKLVIQPEIRFMTIQPQEKSVLLLKQKPQPEPQQYIVVPPQQEAPQATQIKSYPKSLLDSYVPSVLQLQYLKAQQLKNQELQQEQFSKQVLSQPEATVSGNGEGNAHLLNTIEYANIPEQKFLMPLKSASTKRFTYQNYFPIQHGGGGTSYVNYRLGRYADH